MFKDLRLGPFNGVKPSHHLAQISEPLRLAAERGDNVSPIVMSIAKSFGFDGFLYGASMSLQPMVTTRQFIFSTWPSELFPVYDARGYIEVDPRVRDLLESVAPLIWDQSTYQGQSAQIDEFMAWLRGWGICSGVTCPLRDVRGRLGALFLSSGVHHIDASRRLMIERNMGDIIQFGGSFHELFVNGALNELMGPPLGPGHFTKRERECLKMASEGLTTEDIATRLACSLRSVQGYFERLKKKMGVHNRLEAVTRGFQIGII